MPIRHVLPQSFFARPTLTVCRELLGKVLVRKVHEGTVTSMITEVEAYDGPFDKASHAHRGKTQRNAPMFGPAGYWYIYLCYGVHWMLNVTTRKAGYPAAILIRGTVDAPKPGVLTRHFHIDRSLNALPASTKTGLWIEDRGVVIRPKDILRTPRIGVGYAKEWVRKPYRFLYTFAERAQ